MGITRLTTLLNRDVVIADLGRETLPRAQSKHLLVDASNYLWHLLDERPVPETFEGLVIRDHSGFSRLEVVQFLADLGFELNRDAAIDLPTTDEELCELGDVLSWAELKAELQRAYDTLKREGEPLPSLNVSRFERELVCDPEMFKALVQEPLTEDGQERLTILCNGASDLRGERFGGFGQALPRVETTDSGLLDRRYGGTYDELVAIVAKDIADLQSMGFKLTFVLDHHEQASTEDDDDAEGEEEGEAQIDHHSIFKKEVRASRKKDQISNWEQLQTVIDDELRVFSQKNLPLPPCTFAVYKQFLFANAAKLGFEIDCECGEADPKIHAKCLALQAMGEECYVYSYDTDFEAMRDCPLIKLNCLNPVSKDEVQAIVWRRKRIAQCLGISEKHFVEFCLVMGCDFTKHIDRSTLQYGDRRGLANMTENELFELIRSGNEGERVHTMEDSMSEKERRRQDLAFEYSRAFYEGDHERMDKCAREFVNTLEDDHTDEETSLDEGDEGKGAKDSRTDDASKSVTSSSEGDENEDDDEDNDEDDGDEIEDEDEEDEEFSDMISFNKRFLDHINAWKASTMNTTTHAAVEFLESQLVNDSLSMGQHDIARTTLDYVALTLTAEHVRALRFMLDFLNSHGTSRSKLVLASDQVIEWEDFQAGYLYQKVVLAMDLHSRHSPMKLFNGKVFHYFLYEIRLEAEEADGKYEHDSDDDEYEDDEDDDDDDSEDSEDEDEPAPTHALPVSKYSQEIVDVVNNFDVTLISGKTGCGKSTSVPLLLCDDAISHNTAPRILMIEPRRIAAKELFDRLSHICAEKYPDQRTRPIISLCRGFERPQFSRKTNQSPHLTFATAGYVFAKYLHDLSALGQFTHIVLDEVHERTLEYDLLLFFLKHLVLPHTNTQAHTVKIVLMSATPNFALYKKYFNDDRTTIGSIEIEAMEGRRFDLTRHYIGSESFAEVVADMSSVFKDKCRNVENYCRTVVDSESYANDDESAQPAAARRRHVSFSFFRWQMEVAVALVDSKCRGTTKGVLIFVSGMAEIDEMQKKLRQRMGDRIKILCVHSQTETDNRFSSLAEDTAENNEEQQEKKNSNNKMRVIVATNILESAVTIPDVDVVICLGTQNVREFDPHNPSRTSLINTWIAQSSADQRAGRTGRVRSGTVYHLYTKELYDSVFQREVLPEIESTPLDDSMLKIMHAVRDLDETIAVDNTHGLKDLSFIFAHLPTRTPEERVTATLDELERLKLIHNDDGNAAHSFTHAGRALSMTYMGHFCALLPVNVRLARMMYFGELLNLRHETSAIAAVITSSEDPFRSVLSLSKYKHPDHANSLIRALFNAKNQLDRGRYSDPLLLYTLLVEYTSAQSVHWKNKIAETNKVCETYCLAHSKIKKLYDHTRSLIATVQRALNSLSADYTIDTDPNRGVLFYPKLTHLNEDKETLLHMILTWTNADNLLKCDLPVESPAENIIIRNLPEFSREKANELFPPQLAPFNFSKVNRSLLEITPVDSQTDLRAAIDEMLALYTRGNTVDVVAVWDNSEGADRQTLTLHCAPEPSLCRKVEDFLLSLTQGESFMRPMDNLTNCWNVPSSLLQHIKIKDLWDKLDSSIEVFLPRLATDTCLMRVYNVEPDMISHDICSRSEEDSVEIRVYNLDGFWTSSEYEEAPGFIKITFRADVALSRNGLRLQDIPSGMRLKNAYCTLAKPRELAIGSCAVFEGGEDTAFEHMQRLSLSVYPNAGAWKIATRTGANIAPMWQLGAQHWSSTYLAPSTIISWSNLRLRRANGAMERSLYAVAAKVTQKRRMIGDRHCPHIIPDQNVRAIEERDEPTDAQGLYHYTSGIVTLLPYPEGWVQTMLSLTGRNFDEGWEGTVHIRNVRHLQAALNRNRASIVFDKPLRDQLLVLHHLLLRNDRVRLVSDRNCAHPAVLPQEKEICFHHGNDTCNFRERCSKLHNLRPAVA